MSIFKELNTEILKYSKKFINKTEIVAQIAKLNIDIKKKSREIVKIKIEIGDCVIEQYGQYDIKDQSVDDRIQLKVEKINIINSEIDHLKIEIESLKSQLWESESKNEDINNPS